MYAFLMPKKRGKKAGAPEYSGYTLGPERNTVPPKLAMFFSLLRSRQKRKEPKEKAAPCARINSLIFKCSSNAGDFASAMVVSVAVVVSEQVPGVYTVWMLNCLLLRHFVCDTFTRAGCNSDCGGLPV